MFATNAENDKLTNHYQHFSSKFSKTVKPLGTKELNGAQAVPMRLSPQ